MMDATLALEAQADTEAAEAEAEAAAEAGLPLWAVVLLICVGVLVGVPLLPALLLVLPLALADRCGASCPRAARLER